MIVQVTTEDIRDGVKRDSHKCPIALALAREFPQEEVEVWYDEIRVGENVFWTNTQIEDFELAFDTSKSVEPFSFDLYSLPTYEEDLWVMHTEQSEKRQRVT